MRTRTMVLAVAALLAHGTAGCSDSDDSTGERPDTGVADAGAADTMGVDVPTSDVPIASGSVSFLEPAAAQALVGGVTITVRADGGATAPRVTTPAGLVDLDDDPAVFRAVWDSESMAEGPSELVATALDSLGGALEARLPVTIKHPERLTIEGTAWLDAPLAEARVEVRAYGSDDLLAEGKTDALGAFSLRVLADTEGLVRVDVMADADGFVPADARLSAAFPVREGRAEVNALTHLVVFLADAHERDGLEPAAALSLASARLAEHVLRPEGFDPTRVPALDIRNAEEASWPAATTAVGLFHLGLAELAASESTPLAALVDALAKDLGDGVFDGADADRAPLFFESGAALDADVTRWALAEETHLFIVNPNRNATDLSYETLAADDGFYTLVSTDAGPLYPPEPVPVRFDVVAPVVIFNGETPLVGTYLNQPFNVRAQVTDASPVAELRLFSPSADALTMSTIDAAAGLVEATIDPTALGDGSVLLRVDAIDTAGNEGRAEREVFIDLTPPTLAITLPEILGLAAPPLEGTASDAGSGVASVKVTVNGQNAGVAIADAGFSASPAWVPGSNEVVVVASDVAGNSASVEGSVLYDPNPPNVAITQPAADAFVGPAGVDIKILASDDDEVVAVEVAVGEAHAAATDHGTQWAIDGFELPAPDGPREVVATALDRAGNPAVASVTVQRDTTGPTISTIEIDGAIEHAGKTWVGTYGAAVRLTVDDGAGIGVQSVSVAGAPATFDGTHWVVLVELTSEGGNQLAVVATDALANTTTTTTTLHRDTLPPECVLAPLEAPLHAGRFWLDAAPVALDATATDGGIGVEDVTSLAGALAGDVLHHSEGWAIGQELAGDGPVDIVVTCSDGLGHAASVSVPVHLDTAAPTIGLFPTSVIDEATATLAVEADGTVSYELHLADTVWFPASCVESGAGTGFDCPTRVGKFAHRFGYGMGPAADANLLHFAPDVGDGASGLDADDLNLSYRFELADGSPLGEFQPVPQLEGRRLVPLSNESVGGGAQDSCAWLPEVTPAAIVLAATDIAGNRTERRWSFALTVLPAPLVAEELANWELKPWDLRSYRLGGTDAGGDRISSLFEAELPGAVGERNGPRLTRFRVSNPSPCATALEVDIPPLRLWYTWARRYLLRVGDQGACAGECDAFECRYDLTGPSPPVDECNGELNNPTTTWLSEQALWPEHELLASTDEDAAQPAPLPTDAQGRGVVAGGEAVLVDLFVPTKGTCLLGGRSYTFRDFVLDTGSTTRFVETYSANCANEGPSAADFADCTDDLPAELGGCRTNRYDAPAAVTSLSIGPAPPDGPLVFLTLSFDHFLPDIAGDKAYTRTLARDVRWTTALEGLKDKPYLVP